MVPELLRIVATVLSATGSILLAWRVAGILRALGKVASVHEQNILSLADHHAGAALYVRTNATAYIKRANKLGMLILGLSCVALSAILQLIALVL